jgi:hypothetical protein
MCSTDASRVATIPPPRWGGCVGYTPFHGLRCAPPVATTRRPVGARESRPVGAGPSVHERSHGLRTARCAAAGAPPVATIRRPFFGAGVSVTHLSTGCAALHPWLQPVAPLGREEATIRRPVGAGPSVHERSHNGEDRALNTQCPRLKGLCLFLWAAPVGILPGRAEGAAGGWSAAFRAAGSAAWACQAADQPSGARGGRRILGKPAETLL